LPLSAQSTHPRRVRHRPDYSNASSNPGGGASPGPSSTAGTLPRATSPLREFIDFIKASARALAASSGSNQTDDAGNRKLAVQETGQSRKTPVSIGYYRWSTIRFGIPSYPVLLHTTPRHSHSLVPSDFEVTSKTARWIPRTSLIMRVAMRPRNSGGNHAQSRLKNDGP